MFLMLDMTLVKINRAKTDILSAIGLGVVSSENDVRKTVLLDAFSRKEKAFSSRRYDCHLAYLDLHVMIPNPCPPFEGSPGSPASIKMFRSSGQSLMIVATNAK